ncbi:YheV family putative zinc ribbon protein [Motilimonas pumila]|uniref:YheV family putative metal-binding protein n=1 Tax=Motilimonas pumila TaxID=2303987 RepID=A0A418YF52_9GAMM|nr:YheV family putative zinc ribbon protein [Motilimonas pumila]RJG47897.1 YheV family putative metal-binding protein [Motilimonas pumila]
MSKKKRFIAGATCPSCRKLDTIVVFVEQNVEKVNCIECGYTQSQAPDEISGATRQFEQVLGIFNPDDN